MSLVIRTLKYSQTSLRENRRLRSTSRMFMRCDNAAIKPETAITYS